MHLTLGLKHVLGHRTSKIKLSVGMFTELCLFMCKLLKIEYHWKTCRIGIAVAEIFAYTLTDVLLETQCFQKKLCKGGIWMLSSTQTKIPWQSQASENIPIQRCTVKAKRSITVAKSYQDNYC